MNASRSSCRVVHFRPAVYPVRVDRKSRDCDGHRTEKRADAGDGREWTLRTSGSQWVGERIGAYEILRLLGHGEVASVYECRHESLGRLAAVKVLHPHLARDQGAARRFLREARALSRIEHPNVVEVFDVGERDGVPYLVMSLVDGEDLQAHFRQYHPMSVTHIADCTLPVIAAVAAAYDAGIVHRDVKPTNIRLARDHRGHRVPKVLDFGISKLSGDERGMKLTESDGMLATASYMSPEQLGATKHANVRSDVYALGVIVYQAATGKRPFDGNNAHDLMHAILTASVPPPSYYRREISRAFDAVVLRAMKRNPMDRFASARELGHALAPFSSEPAAWSREFTPLVEPEGAVLAELASGRPFA
jgi:serine/threonine protein kinase